VPIAPPGQEGWREAPGWLFLIEEFCLSKLNHHPVCAFGAATPPGQEGLSALARFEYALNRRYLVTHIIHALEIAAAILLGVVILTGVVTALAVKRGEAALDKHHH